MGVRIPLLAPNVEQQSTQRSGQLKLAALLYAGLALAAVAWSVLAGRPHLVYVPGQCTLFSLAWGAAAGAGLGLLVVLLSQVSLRYFGWARELYRWFAGVLGPLTGAQAFWFALLSATGEELFFRGAMQPSLGLWITSIIFGLAHLPPRRRYLHWTVSALLLGLGFGVLTEQSGNLAGAWLGHLLVNWLNLGQLKRFHAAHVEIMGGLTPPEDHGIANHAETDGDDAAPGGPDGPDGTGPG